MLETILRIFRGDPKILTLESYFIMGRLDVLLHPATIFCYRLKLTAIFFLSLPVSLKIFKCISVL